MWRFVMILVLASPAWGCECSGWLTPKRAWQSANAVVEGTVVSVESSPNPRDPSFTNRIRVDRSLKGSRAGAVFEVRFDGSMCDPKFHEGQQQLFFLFQDRHGSWAIASMCFPQGKSLQSFMRRLPQSAEQPRLAGMDTKSDASYLTLGPVPALVVKVTSASGAKYQTRTDADGLYEFYELPAGKYRVAVDAPVGWRVDRTYASKPQPMSPIVDLKSDGEIEVNFDLRADTRITGRVVNSEGEAVPNICIEPVPFDTLSDRGIDRACSRDKTGQFQFEMIPPGKYLLITHDHIWKKDLTSESTLYYPGVRDRTKAKLITVTASKYATGLEMMIPDRERRFEISGVVEISDGSFHSGNVIFEAPEIGYRESADISPTGHFQFTAVAGIEGILHAAGGVLLYCPQASGGSIRHVETTKMPMKIDADHRGVKFVVADKFCESPAPH
jgi:hypothetical protein